MGSAGFYLRNKTYVPLFYHRIKYKCVYELNHADASEQERIFYSAIKHGYIIRCIYILESLY